MPNHTDISEPNCTNAFFGRHLTTEKKSLEIWCSPHSRSSNMPCGQNTATTQPNPLCTWKNCYHFLPTIHFPSLSSRKNTARLVWLTRNMRLKVNYFWANGSGAQVNRCDQWILDPVVSALLRADTLFVHSEMSAYWNTAENILCLKQNHQLSFISFSTIPISMPDMETQFVVERFLSCFPGSGWENQLLTMWQNFRVSNQRIWVKCAHQDQRLTKFLCIKSWYNAKEACQHRRKDLSWSQQEANKFWPVNGLLTGKVNFAGNGKAKQWKDHLTMNFRQHRAHFWQQQLLTDENNFCKKPKITALLSLLCQCTSISG